MDEQTWLVIAGIAVLVFLGPFLARLVGIGMILVVAFLYVTNPTLLGFNDFLRQAFISTKDPSLVAFSGLISKIGTEATTRDNYYLASVYTIDLSLLTLLNPEIPTSIRFLGIGNHFFRIPSSQELDAALEEGRRKSAQQVPASVGASPSAPATSIRQVRVIAPDELNVRSGPGANYPVAGKVFSGNVLRKYAEQNGWTQIDGGWVRSSLVAEVD